MKGFITKIVAGSCLSASVMAFAGCTHYRDIVDPCWPDRYNAIARASVNQSYNVQAEKGHILDQSIWNWHFDTDPKGGPSATLNGAGMETLRTISRRLPAPDYQLYLQAAQDLHYTPGVAPEKLVAERNKLNERRVQAIQNFLATQTPMHGGGVYSIGVHDFAPSGNPAFWTEMAQKKFEQNILTGQMQIFTGPKVN